MNLKSYVQWAYNKTAWTEAMATNARRGFVAAVRQGWDNADGTAQEITLARFGNTTGAASALDEVISYFKQEPKPATMLADPAIGAVGWSSPRLDSQGYCEVEIVAAIGDTMILVVETTAATPDPAAAKMLLQEQYDRLNSGS
jgi:hypothetical protein